MSNNSEMLQKAVANNSITTSVINSGTGGLLNPVQANRFLDYLYEQSVLVKDARFIRMNNPSMNIDKVAVNTRILVSTVEADDAGYAANTIANQKPTFTKISLTTTKLRLDWELSTEGLEDNIEGTSLEDHIASLMARQTANDLEDLFINGDKTSGNALLKALDGWVKLSRVGGGSTPNNAGQVVDVAGANLTRATFDKALRALPNKYLQRRSQLKWYTSSSLIQDYLWSLTLDYQAQGVANLGLGAPAPGSTLGEGILGGAGGAQGGGLGNQLNAVRPFGIGLLEVPLYNEAETGSYTGAAGNHGVLELTFPNNRIVGVQRDVTVYREFKPKKDSLEFTLFVRVANQIEDGASYVHVRNVKLRP